MPVRRPQQARYNTVATNDAEADGVGSTALSEQQQEQQQQQQQRATSSISNPTSTSYSSVPNTEEEDEQEQEEIELKTVTTTATTDDDDKAEDDTFSVTILDFTHTKFTLSGLRRTDTVRQLKQRGAAVHGVPVLQQRLVYRGKLLADADVLETVLGLAAGGTTTPDGLFIVHLFPKPRVVVVNSSTDSNDSINNNAEESPSTGGTTLARIPTIVLDADEAAQRSQILVLGSVDYIEAVNNVKLFSFMLLIISTIELLNLTAIALGDGQALNRQEPIDPWEDQDDFFDHGPDIYHNSSSSSSNSSNFTNAGGDETLDPAMAIYETWQPLSYLDMMVSLVGVYVALLGIRASNENRSTMARWYFWGTCAVAVGWLLFNFLISLQVDQAVAAEQQEEEENNSQNDEDDNNNPQPDPYNNSYNSSNGESVYSQAFNVMVLPAMVWCLCIFRAWQFQSLLTEAEQEAAERIAAQAMEITNRSRDDYGGDNDDEELAVRGATPS